MTKYKKTESTLYAIEIIYAGESIPLAVRPGATVRDAIEQSGVLEQFPDIDLKQQSVQVEGKTDDLNDRVDAGDSIEICA